MNAFYTLLYLTALPLILPFQYFKRHKDVRNKWLCQKLGWISVAQKAKKSILVHCVSVGETLASISLIKRLHNEYPDYKIYISTITDTGQAIANAKLGDIAEVIYIAFDLPSCLSRFLNTINPSLILIMETELWPNLISYANSKGIPIVLINGRLSEKSFLRYSKIKSLLTPTLEKITHYCVQEEIYHQRFLALGVLDDSLTVTGNMKFDIHDQPQWPQWADKLKGPTIIAGSTHHPEERLIIETYLKLKESMPEINLIIAPRHPKRFSDVQQMLLQKGINPICISKLCSSDTHEIHSAVLILDVMGQLLSTYAVADIAIIGGSFIKHGGQNPLEPAIWGKAIVCGRNMQNFPFIGEFYQKGAAIEVDESNLLDTLLYLLQTPSKVKEMGTKAKLLITANVGAVDKTLAVIKRFLQNG